MYELHGLDCRCRGCREEDEVRAAAGEEMERRRRKVEAGDPSPVGKRTESEYEYLWCAG